MGQSHISFALACILVLYIVSELEGSSFLCRRCAAQKADTPLKTHTMLVAVGPSGHFTLTSFATKNNATCRLYYTAHPVTKMHMGYSLTYYENELFFHSLKTDDISVQP